MIAFLILAHNEPEHAANLVKRLISPCSSVFIHVDAKSDVEKFKSAIEAGAIPVDKRHKVYWGGWSQVKAALELVKKALRSSDQFTHFALLSGVDYPLARPEAMLAYFKSTLLEHINCAPLPADHLGKPITRLTTRQLEGGYRQIGIRATSIRFTNKMLKLLPQRDISKCLSGLHPYGGSNWWVLTRTAVSKAIEIEESGGVIMRTFKTSHCPDESFFQTVVANHIGIKRIGRSVTYADWNCRNPPAILDANHINKVTTRGFELSDYFGIGPCLFIRKFPSFRDDLRRIADSYAENRTVIT